jgi:hypothetical protein
VFAVTEAVSQRFDAEFVFDRLPSGDEIGQDRAMFLKKASDVWWWWWL